MSIEKAINQTRPFRNNRHKAAVNILYTYHWLTGQLKSILKPYDITLQQYNVLRILRGAREPISTSVIRARLLDKMADTSRMVNRLYEKNLVVRTECQHDKRLVDVSLSEEGEALMKQLDHMNDDIDQLLSQISEEEAGVLSELLDRTRG
jgi:DNA-binding MarR family transcriptional regulator